MKKAKQLTVGVAVSSLIFGTSSHLVGSTFGAFNSKDTSTSEIQACEVFPTYINEQLQELKKLVDEYNIHFDEIPKVNSYSGDFKINNDIDQHSVDELLNEKKRMNNLVEDVDKAMDDLKNLEKELGDSREILKADSMAVYESLRVISSLPEKTVTSCLKGTYPAAGQELVETFEKYGLSNRQVNAFLNYFYQKEFTQSDTPVIGKSTLTHMESSFKNKIISSEEKIEANKKDMNAKKQKLQSSLENIEKAIEKLKKEEAAAKEAEAKAKETEAKAKESETAEKDRKANVEKAEQEDPSQEKSAEDDQEPTDTQAGSKKNQQKSKSSESDITENNDKPETSETTSDSSTSEENLEKNEKESDSESAVASQGQESEEGKKASDVDAAVTKEDVEKSSQDSGKGDAHEKDTK